MATSRGAMLQTFKDGTFLLRRRIANTVYPLSRRLHEGSAASYSAFGEDLLALSWLNVVFGVRADEIRYLDIGACHPTKLSNTFLMYKLGATGVLVEPDPIQTKALSRARPRDTVIQAGAAFDDKRIARLDRHENPVFNSFRATGLGTTGHIDVPLIPMNELLSEHFSKTPPDFMSIDAEGCDFDILKSIDISKHRPRVICIETSNSVAEYASVLADYEFVARTPDNAIFITQT